MVSDKIVSGKMEIVQHIFRQAQSFSCERKDWNELAVKLDSLDAEFRSVAYEAASMNIALKDFSESKPLTEWLDFLNEYGKPQAVQTHVGLGWALAQQQLNPLPYLNILEPMLRYRVMDGYGYYEGIFRRRKSIQQQQRHEFSDVTALKACDQGIGRSIWYINGGEIDSAKKMLESISTERHRDLWRGLGIACAYVGGCDEETLEEIFLKSGGYKKQLAAGAAMAAVSRNIAGYMSADTALTCKVWCKQNVEKLVSLYKPESNLNADDSYSVWISEMEGTI